MFRINLALFETNAKLHAFSRGNKLTKLNKSLLPQINGGFSYVYTAVVVILQTRDRGRYNVKHCTKYIYILLHICSLRETSSLPVWKPRFSLQYFIVIMNDHRSFIAAR